MQIQSNKCLSTLRSTGNLLSPMKNTEICESAECGLCLQEAYYYIGCRMSKQCPDPSIKHLKAKAVS